MKEIIPALPGHSVLFLDAQGQVERAAVMAWEIVRLPYDGPADMPIDLCVRYYGVPVTGRKDISTLWAIRKADGRFECPQDNMVFDNEEDAVKYLRLVRAGRTRPMEVA